MIKVRIRLAKKEKKNWVKKNRRKNKKKTLQ